MYLRTKNFLKILIVILVGIIIGETKISSSFQEQILLYKTSSYEEALSLSEEYDLELVRYGYSGLARYKTNDEYRVDFLLTQGFNRNYTYYPQLYEGFSFNDQYLSDQYALFNTKINLAWKINVGESDVVIAIIDTGIDLLHPEFKNRLSVKSYNSYDDLVGLEYVQDDQGHGTLVAGVIGANSNNTIGIAGIAQNVELLIIKANLPDRDKGYFDDGDVIDGIYYAVDNGANIINLSLGGPNNNPAMEEAIEYAYSNNVAVIAAAGNSGDDGKLYPAAFDSVISVSAVDENNVIAEYSNYGPTITLSAPGNNITTTSLNNTYTRASGTSLAAPQVSGVIALIYSEYDNITIDEVHNRLFMTAIDLGDSGKDIYYGYGLIDAYNSLTLPNYTITFETFDGSNIEPMNVLEHQKIGNLPEALLNDYLFIGWYLDEDLQNPLDLDNFTITSDITLYAKFIKSHYTVTYYVNGEIYYSETVHYLTIPSLPTVNIAHHDFMGWTIDHINFYNNQPITDDLILYAKLELTIYQITFLYNGEVIHTIGIPHNHKIDFPSLEIEDYIFFGWFESLDSTTPFNQEYATSKLTLHAKFKHRPLVINYYHHQELLRSINVEYGTILNPFTPTKVGMDFIGWFIDDNTLIPYTNKNVTSDINLYAKFVEKKFFVRYYNFDKTSILYEQEYIYNQTLDLNIFPNVPETLNFKYEFIGWYTTNDKVIVDLDLYPIYEKQYLEGTIRLSPGIDTIYLGDTWKDESLENIENHLIINQTSDLNLMEIGRYLVTYQVFENDKLITEMFRYVRIIPKPQQPKIVLKPGVDTITVGSQHQDHGVYSSTEDIEIINNVNIRKTGSYEIIYKLVIQDQEFTKVRIVNVINPITNLTNEQILYFKKEEQYDQI